MKKSILTICIILYKNAKKIKINPLHVVQNANLVR